MPSGMPESLRWLQGSIPEPENEMLLRQWLRQWAISQWPDLEEKVPQGWSPNPDDPLHHYDYRSAWNSGVQYPEIPGEHWPSNFKSPDHPDRFVWSPGQGMWDTLLNQIIGTGQPPKEAEPWLRESLPL